MTQELDAVVVKDRIDAGGLDTYYEIHGAGEPLLYLHGGFNPFEKPALVNRLVLDFLSGQQAVKMIQQ